MGKLSITQVVDSFYNTKIGQKIANPMATAATATAIATVSNVSKDAVNCAYYTMQSLNNERIPEDQRKFVAALDLSNGILNVLLQIAMALGINKAVKSIFNDKIAKSRDFSLKPEIIEDKFNKLPEKLRKTTTFEQFKKDYIANMRAPKGSLKLAGIGFSVLFANIAMQILTKRIITPLIATPMASFFKKKFEEAEEKKKAQQGENVIANA